jgi:hypothetical protein
MKRTPSAIAVLLLLASGAHAQEATTPSDKAKPPTEDCSKQVWPHFTPSCLRNAAQTTNVRLVSTERR